MTRAALLSAAVLSALFLRPSLAQGGRAPWPIDVGVHTLLDGVLLDTLSGCALVPGVVHKDPRPRVVREYPWEAILGFYSAVTFIPARLSPSGVAQWHWYYTCAWSDLFTDPPSFCVAVSLDALTWSKPLLPYYPWTGANGTLPPTNTNIVFRTQSNTFSGSVLVDTRTATPREEAFQLGFEASVEGQAIRMPYAARSSDGLHFETWNTAVARGPLLNLGTFADTNLALAGAFGDTGSYVLMTGRTDDAPGGSREKNGQAYCANSSAPHRAPMGTLLECSNSSSSSSRGGGEGCNISSGTWPMPHQLLALGYPDDDQCLDVYNFPAVSLGPDAAFGGRPSWVALPSSIRHLPQAQSGAPISRASGNDGFMDARLAVSRNASSWTTPTHDAFLPRGVGVRDAGSGLFNGSGSDLDAGFVYVANGGVADPDAALPAPATRPAPPSPWLHILYFGGQTTHAGGGAFWYDLPGAFIGLLGARIRREGWMALSSPNTDTGAGWATTLPLLLPLNTTAQGQRPSREGGAPTLVLRLNANVDASGNLTLQLQDAGTMLPLPGYAHKDCLPLRGNGIRQVVVWGGNQSTWLGGSPALPTGTSAAGLVMNFSLVHAKVFAWELAWE
jgi:hypothetical protein